MNKAFCIPIQHNNQIKQQAEACRLVWNYFLTRNNNQYKENKTFVWFNDMCLELTQLKKQPAFSFLKDVHINPLQQKLKDLDIAFKRFLNPKLQADYPVFKEKKNNNDSFRHCNGFNINNRKIKIPKIGYIKWNPHRKLEGKAKSITIKQDLDKWYCSVLCEIPDIQQKEEFNTSIGIDLGLKTFAVLSNGKEYQTPKFYRKSQSKLAKAQRYLSKKAKRSNNKRKARKAVSKINRHIRNQRRNQLHIWSKEITNRFDVICVEDLNIAGMIKNHCLAKSIQDAGWNTFNSYLDYKSKWNGGILVRIDRWYPSSKTCCKCGTKQNMTLDKRTYICGNPECNHVMDRDLNAAINILRMGLSTESISKKVVRLCLNKTNIGCIGDQATRITSH